MNAAAANDISMPALLRAAWTTYGARMRDALALADFDDLPRNGLYVIGALARAETSLADIVRALRVSKQAVGQLVDTLVLRGYLVRSVAEADRRRLTVVLTERGHAAAVVQRDAANMLDAELVENIGPERLAHLRDALFVLARLSDERLED